MKQGNFIIALCSLNLFAIILFAAFYFMSPEKIAYVDSVKLLQGYKGMDDAKKELAMRSGTYSANLDTLKAEFDQVLADYQGNKTATPREKKLMEEIIRSKQEAYLNYEQIVGEQMKKQDQEMSTKLLDKVNEYIKRHGEAKGYKIIFAATPYGNIAYGEKATDITEEILEGLNNEYTK